MKRAIALVLVSILNFNNAKAQEIQNSSSDSSYPKKVSANGFTLGEMLAETYRTNPEIKRARANFEAVAEQRSQALSRFLPDVRAGIDYGRRRTELNNIENSGTVNARSITADQPIFRGGNFSRLEATENQSLAAIYNLQAIEQEVLLKCVDAYMNLLTDAALLETAKNKENVLYRQYEESGKRFKAGELTKTDVSQSISRASASSAEVAIIEASYESSRANFERVVGRVPESLNFPTSLPQIPATEEQTLTLSRSDNPEILAAKHAEKFAEENIDVNYGHLAPSLSLRGRMDREDNYNLAGGDTDYANDQVTLNLSIPLYQTGSEYSRVREAKAEASARKYEYFESIHRSDEQVKSIWKRVLATTRAIDANELEVRAAQLALEGVKKEEQLGVRTLIDVLDAEQELFEAKTRALRSKRDQIIAYYTLLARIGRLTAKDLSLPVEFYDPYQHYDDVKNKFIGF